MGDNNTENDNAWTVVGNKRRKPPVIHQEETQHQELLQESFQPGIYCQNTVQTGNNNAELLNNTFERSNDKISEPCWFYNNGGCRHKDGTEKTAEECKYMHLYSENVKRPPHLSTKKPCDKYNLEGECKWHDNCKYSHRNLTPDEWSRFYPGIPYTLKTNVQKRLLIENRLADLEGKMRVIEFKQDGISRDVQQIGQTLHQLLRHLETQ